MMDITDGQQQQESASDDPSPAGEEGDPTATDDDFLDHQADYSTSHANFQFSAALLPQLESMVDDLMVKEKNTMPDVGGIRAFKSATYSHQISILEKMDELIFEATFMTQLSFTTYLHDADVRRADYSATGHGIYINYTYILYTIFYIYKEPIFL